MANPGQPTIRKDDTGEPVRRAQRCLRRADYLGVAVDGIFGTETETAVRHFQDDVGLRADGIVGELTWKSLPDGSPMPVLKEGDTGEVVRSLQRVLTDGAPGHWETTPQGVDGIFGPNTTASVRAFQTWGDVIPDGVVDQQTWDVATTLESAVGLRYVLTPKP